MPLFDPHFQHHSPLPQFLVISPAKTGSTWLADNLRCHPRIFVPGIKEVKYFSALYKWLDLKWYGAHFSPKPGQISGEASPSYAALPVESIRAIRDLMPDVKLLFLMRDPVSRAWSHAKHTHRYREAGFADCTKSLEQMTDAEWLAAFADDWPLANGDYLGQLRRWRSIFPADRLFVGFFEDIITRPVELLKDVFSFLGVCPNVEMSHYPIRDKILAGPEGELSPALENDLRNLLGPRTRELTDYLREAFALTPPAAWQRTLAKATPSSLLFPESRWDFTEVDLVRISAQEETFRTAYRQVHLDYRGHDLVFYRGRLMALPHSLGTHHPEPFDGPPLERMIAEGDILTAPTLAELKESVTSRVMIQTEARFCSLEAELRAEWQAEVRSAREETARVQANLTALAADVRRPSAIRRALGKVRRRLSSWFSFPSGAPTVLKMPLSRGAVIWEGKTTVKQVSRPVHEEHRSGDLCHPN
ncbi:MAG TPA: sulfotransferase [Urbifossiella sp.]